MVQVAALFHQCNNKISPVSIIQWDLKHEHQTAGCNGQDWINIELIVALC